jgi:hypothetical protein
MPGPIPIHCNDVTFLLDRLGRDVPDGQFVREFTQNSIQAILDLHDRKGIIRWEVDRDLEKEGLSKLCIIDTGTGMTGAEMVKYVNLASTGRKLGIKDNYGSGAKTSSLSRNYFGVVWKSWKNGEGNMVWVYRDPVMGYSMKEFYQGGEWSSIFRLATSAMPADIVKAGGHGTKVTFMGMTESSNTMQPPKDAEYRTRWIAKYLNRRYYKIPEGIEVVTPLKKPDGWEVQAVLGESVFLEDVKASSGTLSMSKPRADIHWWIRNPINVSGSGSGHGKRNEFEIKGHVAALHRDEIYDATYYSAEATKRAMARFGIGFAAPDVIIYVEPFDADVVTDTGRTTLQINGEDLPWDQYTEFFRNNMPEEIRILNEERASSTIKSGEDLGKFLQRYMDRFKFPGYRREKGSEPNGDDENQMNVSRKGRGDGEGGGGGGGGGRERSVSKAEEVLLAEGGNVPSRQVTVTPCIPEFHWVSLRETPDERKPGDGLEDRALEYSPEMNTVTANLDFRVFRSWMEKIENLIKTKVSGAAGIAKKVLMRVVEKKVCEAILGMEALVRSGNRCWNKSDIEKLHTSEALTMVAMQPITIIAEMERMAGSITGLKISDLVGAETGSEAAPTEGP